MNEEQKFLESWTPDYTDDDGVGFYEKGRVSIILSEHKQVVLKEASKWISVEERLPEDKQFVLVRVDCLDKEVQHVVEYHKLFNGESLWQIICSANTEFTFYGNITGITHWQPLHSPPKTEK